MRFVEENLPRMNTDKLIPSINHLCFICGKFLSVYISGLFLLSVAFATIPLPSSPSWTSIDNDYSTGGGFADINSDGFIDFCTANGNDMAINKQGIYMNNGGVLETQASWRSADSGYFGHLYLGDIDNDGNIDMSVSYLGLNVSNQGRTRIYKNNGTGLNANPYWTSSDQNNSFDVCLGDVDLDGDLDVAVATGDAYNNIRTPARIYRNNHGTIETTPYWYAQDSTPSDAIRFADINRDGYLDLIVGGYRKLWVYLNQNGVINPIASWSISERGWILRIATADFDKDDWIDVAVAVNGQLSGDSSRIKVFKNNQGQLNTFASYTMRRNSNYCSCVAWGDVNNDGYLDLAAGGWWEPIVVFENHNGVLDTMPAWSWGGGYNLVSEALVWGDVRNYHIMTKADTFMGDGIRKLFYATKAPMQKFLNAANNENLLPVSNYCYDLLTGWISLNTAPQNSDTLVIRYQYSTHPDLTVTNWTAAVGNYLLHNTTPQAMVQEPLADILNQDNDLMIAPNPFSNQVKFECGKNVKSSIRIYNSAGMLIKTLPAKAIIWNGKDEFNQAIPKGIYFAQVVFDHSTIMKKIVKMSY